MKEYPTFQKSKCNVCGKPCIAMAHGDNYFDAKTQRYHDVVVCFNCDRKYGELAYSEACLRYKAK